MNKGILLNIDDTNYWYTRFNNGIHPDENEMRSMVHRYKDTHVTDLMFCIAGRMADYPSEVYESFLDKYHQTRENGRDVDYKNTLCSVLHEVYEEKGLDPYVFWIDEANRCGIRPWLSVRMNDCHCCADPTSFLHPDFFHDHPEYRRIRHREPEGYFDWCYDYELREIIDRELKLIEELMQRYTPYGIELDWMREAFCFAPGRENCAVITDFMRRVKQLTKLPLCVRVPADPNDALQMGFDVCTWADEGLVDIVVPTARWATTDTDIPVALWKRLLRGTGVKLCPGAEILIRPNNKVFTFNTPAHVFGFANAAYSDGADGLYLFNYFDVIGEKFTHPEPGKEMLCTNNRTLTEVITTAGDPELVRNALRRHMVTFRDLQPIWGTVAAPLPLNCEKGHAVYVKVCTGVLPENAAVTLHLAFREEGEADVYVSSEKAEYTGLSACAEKYTELPMRTYRVKPFPGNYAVVEVMAKNGPLTLEFCEITVAKE